MNGSVPNKNHRNSDDYDYDPLEVIVFASFNVFVSSVITVKTVHE